MYTPEILKYFVLKRIVSFKQNFKKLMVIHTYIKVLNTNSNFIYVVRKVCSNDFWPGLTDLGEKKKFYKYVKFLKWYSKYYILQHKFE